MAKIYRIEFIDYTEPYFCEGSEVEIQDWIKLRCTNQLDPKAKELEPGTYTDQWGRVQLDLISIDGTEMAKKTPTGSAVTSQPDSDMTPPVSTAMKRTNKA